ncbi:MAG: hypothetical protein A2W00_13295 [Candidatus Eisenbacteria bacterium RBG_16_71_46]|nr:MAG: hypothetical protein A2W00_13295 [Candidatus Eisenbacteria bacterium RBG_16_71_46]
MRKGIPGVNPDTSEALVVQSGNFDDQGDLTPAISPDGQWVAFGRKDQVTFDYHIWKVPTAGGAATQLTFTSGVADQYPSWSPDGEWIVFDREIGYPNPHASYKVKANWYTPQDTTTYRVYSAGADRDAATPAFSPDGLIVTMGVGSHSETILDVATHTLDPALVTPKAVAAYTDTAFAIHGLHPVLSPKLSPDGTRLGLRARQIWAVRRNMSEPPRITQVGTQSVVDSTAKVSISAARGLPTTVQVLATDPEGDPITCSAHFLQDGMSFDPATCTLSWTPSVPVGTTLYVKFQVVTDTWPKENGGSDQIIAAFNVVSALRPQAAAPGAASDAAVAEGPNPTRGAFALATPFVQGAVASLIVSDLAGRRVASVRGPSGSRLVWEGRDGAGRPVPPGIYLYRMEVDRQRREGKIVMMR